MATSLAGKQVVSGVDMAYNGRNVERGELFTLDGARNDEKLMDHHYVREFESGKPENCDNCGKQFAAQGHLDNHRREQHPVRERIDVGRVSARRTPDKKPADRDSNDPMTDQDFAARTKVLAEL